MQLERGKTKEINEDIPDKSSQRNPKKGPSR